MLNSLLALMIVTAGAAGNSLEPCPSSPNCVSSQATGSHFIESFTVREEGPDGLDILRHILEERKDTNIVAVNEGEIRVEFRTALGFVDDGHFVFDPANRVIELRSASRKGYWDMGKNRRRLEEIRRAYLARSK